MLTDAVLENCECYFWEQKLLSLVVSFVFALIVWFCFNFLTAYSLTICCIISIALGVGGGCVFYVLTSESFCNAQSIFDRDFTNKVHATAQ